MPYELNTIKTNFKLYLLKNTNKINRLNYKELARCFAHEECMNMELSVKKEFLYEHFDFVMETARYDKFHGYFNENYFTEYDDTKRDKLLDNAICEYIVATLLLDKHYTVVNILK